VKGDCFEKVIDVVTELLALQAEDVMIVHGLPIGQGEENLGRRYWHAWVEAKVRDSSNGGKPTWIVADWSAGKPRTFYRRTSYYRIGKIPQHLVFRYTIEQAAEHMADTGHYGPWVPNADELEEV
jgi:hypothetical protein